MCVCVCACVCVCVCVCVCGIMWDHAGQPFLPYTGDTSGIWRWNENIVFDIPVHDVPRGARLCLAIYAVYGNKKTKKKTGKLEAKGVSGKVPSSVSSPRLYTKGDSPLSDYISPCVHVQCVTRYTCTCTCTS